MADLPPGLLARLAMMLTGGQTFGGNKFGGGMFGGNRFGGNTYGGNQFGASAPSTDMPGYGPAPPTGGALPMPPLLPEAPSGQRTMLSYSPPRSLDIADNAVAMNAPPPPPPSAAPAQMPPAPATAGAPVTEPVPIPPAVDMPPEVPPPMPASTAIGDARTDVMKALEQMAQEGRLPPQFAEMFPQFAGGSLTQAGGGR